MNTIFILLLIVTWIDKFESKLPTVNRFVKNLKCDKTIENPSTFLWSINTWPVSYLFGTIHVPFTQVWPHISLPVRESFRNADKVFFELDLTNEMNHRELLSCQIFKDRSVSDYLDPTTINRIKKLLSNFIHQKTKSLPYTRNISIRSKFQNLTRNWQKKRPFWLLIMLNDLMKTTDNEIAVLDLYLAQESRRMKKELGSVENVSDQCDPMNSIPERHVANLIMKTVNNLDRQLINKTHFNSGHDNYDLESMINLYNCGDPSIVENKNAKNQLPSISIEEIMEKYKENSSDDANIDQMIHYKMVVQRNENMAKRIGEELQRSNAERKSAFFAIGVGHFFGNNTILDFLRAAGYKTNPIKRNILPTYHSPRLSQNGNANQFRVSEVNKRNRKFHKTIDDISMPDDGTLLLDESNELPPFKPKFVNFQNNLMSIEEFNKKSLNGDGMSVVTMSKSSKLIQTPQTESRGYSFHSDCFSVGAVLSMAFLIGHLF